VQYDSVTAMVSEDGRFRILGADGHVLAGSLGTSGDLLSGSGIDFATPGVEYLSGPTTDLWIDGQVAERQSMKGRWGTEWGGYGFFTFDYAQELHQQPTSLTDLAGVWQSEVPNFGQTHIGAWTVEPDGRFSGQDNLGCLQSGQFSLIDDRFNIVAVQLDVAGCNLAGSYSGLAQLTHPWGKLLNVFVDDGAHAMSVYLYNDY
jgi:hypothetical protein